MAAFQRLRVADLLTAYLSFPAAGRKSPQAVSFILALMIIRHFLGDQWITDNLDASSRTDGFMRLYSSDPAEQSIQNWKVVDLTEMLFNLQGVPGFEERVSQMRTEALVEASLAELDIGRMLYLHNYPFKFVKRTQVKGADYDLEIKLDQWAVCADVKCKLEDTSIAANTIINALAAGRSQLPQDKPGMLFVKVPQNWMLKFLHAQLMADAARTFFSRGSRRVVSVKFYIAPLQVSNGFVTQTHQFKEVANRRNRFDPSRSWELFTWRDSTGRPPEMMRTLPRNG